MADRFSDRHGYHGADVEITVHEDAPESLRYAIPLIGEEIGMSPSAMRRIICQVLLTPPDRNNWSEHPNIWEEVVGLVADCPWYKVYDIAAIPDTSISGRRVARELTALIARRGRPAMIVSDNGTEFTSTAILAWAQDHGVDWHYIAPGKPTQNGFVESFNGRMRDELLNESLFFSLDHARQKVAAWALDYNTRRPHSSIGYLTPEAFAASLTATGRPAAQDESCAARPVAHPTLRGVTNPRTLVAAG